MTDRVALPSTRRVLEVDRLLGSIAAHAQTMMGRALLAELTASAEEAEVRRRHEEAAQVAALTATAGFAGLAGAAPLAELLVRASAPGAILEPEQLRRVAVTARVAEALRRRFGQDRERWPAAAAIAAMIAPLGPLVEQIEGLFTPAGEMRDDASPELRRLRTRLRRLRASVRQRLERLVQEAQLRPALREKLVTERRGRFVVPVRADQRERVAGIVHDASASRQTLFVEPQEVVGSQNEIAELEGREREEVQRLLAAATGHVRAAAEALRRSEKAVARADALQAVVRWAQTQEAAAAQPGRPPRLAGARHPLLARERFVPLDLALDEDTRAIVITGPNTGGKTVALKTVGLLAWMNQAGLPVPAASARLPVYPRIHADIGDEQSLEASLSTFSGHIAHIVEFLGDCPDGSLVLLDELGTGTDPTEGAALAIALLERFVRLGATVLASTHHDALKAYAHRAEGVVNAAMEFDPRSLRPTYRMRVGRPGRSNALEIARRVGLDRRLVARARSLLDGDTVRLDEILRTLEREAHDATRERQRLRAAEERIERLERELRDRERQRAREHDDALQSMRAALEKELARIRREGERLLEKLLAGVPRRTVADQRARWAAQVGKLRVEGRRRLQQPRGAPAADRRVAPAGGRAMATGGERGAGDARPATGAAGPELPAAGAAAQQPLARGQTVLVHPFGLNGVVLRDWRPDDDATVEVDVAGKRLRVGREAVTPAAAPAGRRGGVVARHRPRRHIAAEIDLHGLTVQEALARVDRYLDDALLAGLSTVRLVHGIGSGRLREALHAWLARRPHVRAFELAPPERGGAGATLVRLGD